MSTYQNEIQKLKEEIEELHWEKEIIKQRVYVFFFLKKKNNIIYRNI